MSKIWNLGSNPHGAQGIYYDNPSGERQSVGDALDGKQASDADLTAIAALSGTGIALRTGADTWSLLNYTARTSFTPTFTFATPGDLAVAYSAQVGEYIRVGDRVDIWLAITFTPTYTTASGAATIGGLPVTSANVSGLFYSMAIGHLSQLHFDALADNIDISSIDEMMTARLAANSTAIGIMRNQRSAATTAASTGTFPSGTQFSLSLSGSFPV